ncbi:SEC-C metal-binding domain-containing protein [Streptomyces sp. NPDC002156]
MAVMSRRTAQSRRQRPSAPVQSSTCPCGLAETYEKCCGRFHRGESAHAPWRARSRTVTACQTVGRSRHHADTLCDQSVDGSSAAVTHVPGRRDGSQQHHLVATL